MSMKNSGRPRRPCMIRATIAWLMTGSVAPVEVTTMSTLASAVCSSSHCTGVPLSARARSWARAQVRLAT